MSSLVRLEGVTKDYPRISTSGDRLRTLAALLLRRKDMPHFRALDSVALEVRKGQSLGIVGENGAGKSTLLKIIAGVVRPTAGTVTVNARVGALLELGSGFHPEYTGRENIHLSGALMGMSRREVREKIDSIIEFADIGEHIDEPIKHYSSGMVVRLGFAAATAQSPEVLITDEVLAVGDESFQKKCTAWLERYLDGGGTLLLCSHSMYHVQTLCTQALWIHHGRVHMHGNSFDVTQEYLAYHERKNSKASAAPRVAEGPYPRIVRAWTEDASGAPATMFRQFETMVLQGVAYDPDDRPPVALWGVVRVDGTPVYGSHSNESGYQLERLEPKLFGFAVRMDKLLLLPGKYWLRLHTLDSEGLRLFDTVEVEIVVRGETRDYGVVALPHEWSAGRGKPLGEIPLDPIRHHEMTEQRIQEARRLHLRGDLARAISAYDELLASDPALAEVWHLKGMAEHQAGKLAEAQASAARAIASGGERPGFLLLEAGVLHDQGDLAAALKRYERVIAAKPDWAVGHLELGRVQMDQGRADIAVESFRTAVTLDPKYVRAWNNLGVALQSLDRMEEAIRAFTHTLALDPRYALAHFNLARIYNLRADSKRALEHAQAAVKADERLSEGWLLVGDIHRRNRETQPALTAYGMAIRAAPGDLKAPNAYAEMLAEIGRYDEAKRAYAQIAGRAPGNLKAALGANLLLPHVYDSVDHIEASRRWYTEGLERLHEAVPRFEFPNGETALTEARWTNFYLAYQGKNDLELQKRYGQFQRRVLEPTLPEFFRPRPRRAGGSRIRVGFFSHFFFNCTAGRYFSSWITHLDKSRFETFVYYTNEWVADDTRIIGAAADTYRHLPGRPLYNLARQVADDNLDILVYPELGMHPDTFTLGGLRLAPVQCSGWGHPNTTGLSEIDWFISCEGMEPADGASRYSERLALLPGLGTRYAIPSGASSGSRSDFGIPDDRTAYLVPQMLFKVHPDNDELIAEVLKRDPRGVVVMFASTHDALTQAFATRLSKSLGRRGLNIHDRVVFIMPFVPHPTYLRLNELCDVMLDTLHWSGGNTSLDALASGLPVVTMPGPLMRGRQSQAMLKVLGAGELVVDDIDRYIDTAVRLGRDATWRRALSERILANRGELFEREEPIRALEDFLESAAQGRRA